MHVILLWLLLLILVMCIYVCVFVFVVWNKALAQIIQTLDDSS